jgi:hypothetical protein
MEQQLNGQARLALREIIVENGRSVVRDRARLNSFLRDLCPDCNGEIEVLLSAADGGVPQQLLALPEQSTVQLGEMTERLVKLRGLAKDDAGWAVNAWLFALDLRAKAEPPEGTPIETPAVKNVTARPAVLKLRAPEAPRPLPAPEAPKANVQPVPAATTVPRGVELDSWASKNRSAGWKRLYLSLLLLFFIGGGGAVAAANEAGGGALGGVLAVVCGILVLTGLSGVYKIITGR